MSTRVLRVAVVGSPGPQRDQAVHALSGLPGVRVLARSRPRRRLRRLTLADLAVAVVGPGTVPGGLQLITSLAGEHQTHVLGPPCSPVERQFLHMMGAAAYHDDIESLADAVGAEQRHGRRRSRLAALRTPDRDRHPDRDMDFFIEAACELTRRREHTRYARLLHDRVLQTMEMLSRPESTLDGPMRVQLGRDTAWLRGLLERGPRRADPEITARDALVGMVTEYDGSRLRVTLTAEGQDWQWPDLPAETVGALCDATREALHNVRKHARTFAAHVTTRPRPNGVEVRIRDRGIGFDPARCHRGFGIADSVKARLAEVGGGADISSAVGAGTEVRLFVPVQSSCP
jgi:signal transduction histidine kinase